MGYVCLSLQIVILLLSLRNPGGGMAADVSVSLSTNLTQHGNRAYDRQVVTFRCVIVGVDTIINWGSEHYIGTGGDVLQLASADPPGQTASNPRNPTTIATLVSTSRSGGVTTTVSELRLTASSQFPTSNVSCANNGHGPVNTTSFRTIDPDVKLTHNLFGNRAYDRQVVTFRCVIVGVDTIINWRSDHYIGAGGDVLQLASADPPGQTASNPRNPMTIATLVSTSRSSGVTTTVSELRLTASSQFPTSSVSCADNSHGPVNTTVFQTLFALVPETATTSEPIVTTSMSAPDDQFHTTAEHDDNNNAAAWIAGIILLFGAIVIICVVIAIIMFVWSRRKSRVGSNKMPQRQPECRVPYDVTDKELPAPPVKETNEEPDYIEPLEKSENKPLLAIDVGISNTGVVLPRRDTSNIWKQPVGLAHYTSLPSVRTCMYMEDIVTVSSSLPQLNTISLFTQYHSEQHGIDADIESGSDIHEPSEKEANEKPDEVEHQKKSEKKYIPVEFDIKERNVIRARVKGLSGARSRDSGLGLSGAPSRDNGLDDDSPSHGNEKELAIKKCEQVDKGAAPDPAMPRDPDVIKNPHGSEHIKFEQEL